MDQWKHAIVKGNSAFVDHRFDTAERHYKAACDRARTLLPQWFDVEDITVAVVISFQNLADLYFQQGRFSDALDTYRQLGCLIQDYQTLNAGCHHVQFVTECARRRLSTEFLATVKTLAPDTSDPFFRQAEGVWHELADAPVSTTNLKKDQFL